MRRQRSGQIINVSSLPGLMGTPAQAFYSASKFALEDYSEALSNGDCKRKRGNGCGQDGNPEPELGNWLAGYLCC